MGAQWASLLKAYVHCVLRGSNPSYILLYSSHSHPYPPLLAFIIGQWILDEDAVLKQWPVLGHSTPEELSASQILSCGIYLYMLCGLCDTNIFFVL
jgi:hypothetical protein